MRTGFVVRRSAARAALLMVACACTAWLAACARHESGQSPAQAASAIPVPETAQAAAVHDSPRARRFQSASVPAFAPGSVRLTLLTSRSAALKPKALAPDLLYPQDLVYDANGVLYVVASRAPTDNPDDGLNTDLILAIAPDGKARVFAESGIQGYPMTDHGRVPNYNGFSDLDLGPRGGLVALRNDAYPVFIAPDGVVSFIPFKIPGGSLIGSFGDWDSSTETKKWRVVGFGSNEHGRLIIDIEAPNPTWYAWVPGGVLEEIKNPDELPANVTLYAEHIPGQLGPDGYSYFIEKGSDSKHATLMRLGDPGQSILNPNATRTVIMELNIKHPTGYLAFGPNRQLAVGSEDGIYVVEPIQ